MTVVPKIRRAAELTNCTVPRESSTITGSGRLSIRASLRFLSLARGVSSIRAALRAWAVLTGANAETMIMTATQPAAAAADSAPETKSSAKRIVENSSGNLLETKRRRAPPQNPSPAGASPPRPGAVNSSRLSVTGSAPLCHTVQARCWTIRASRRNV